LGQFEGHATTPIIGIISFNYACSTAAIRDELFKGKRNEERLLLDKAGEKWLNSQISPYLIAPAEGP
jgi:hypothetical protein